MFCLPIIAILVAFRKDEVPICISLLHVEASCVFEAILHAQEFEEEVVQVWNLI